MLLTSFRQLETSKLHPPSHSGLQMWLQFQLLQVFPIIQTLVGNKPVVMKLAVFLLLSYCVRKKSGQIYHS